MEQFKRAQVIMLPTDKVSHIQVNRNDKLYHSYEETSYNDCINQELYITSDDKIKEEGNWCIHPTTLNISKHHSKDNNLSKGWKKIIATTDTSLKYIISNMIGIGIIDTSESLPQPSQQFITKYIESYNKGEVITDVLVEYELQSYTNRFETNTGNGQIWGHKEQLKVNPKDNTITIKKLKDSWNREEVRGLLIRLHDQYPDRSELTNWINQNL